MPHTDGAAGTKDGGYLAVRFSTADHPAHKRLDAWREIYGREFQKLDIEPLSDRPLYTEAVLRRMPGLSLNVVRRSAVVHDRRREFVDHDDVGVTVGLTAPFEASQFGRTVALSRGDAIVLTGAEPATLRAPTAGAFIHLRVPKRALAPLVDDLDAAYGRRLPAGNTALRLLTRYVGVLDETETLAAPELRRQAVAYLHDLLALAIGARDDAAEDVKRRGGRAARFCAIKEDIADHLGETDLSVRTVAARQKILPRSVQRLFEAEGTTFTEHVLAERLARAHRRLLDPRRAGRSISIIAFEAGFGDLSYFNRVFRRRYGATPSELRAAAEAFGPDQSFARST